MVSKEANLQDYNDMDPFDLFLSEDLLFNEQDNHIHICNQKNFFLNE